MRSLFHGVKGMAALSVLMLILLFVLAALQYRWTGQLGIAEREQMRLNVESTLARYAEDFDRELTRALLYFLPARPTGDDDEAALLERYDYWVAHAPHPELIGEVYLARRSGNGIRLAQLDPAHRQVETVAWDDTLETIRQALSRPERRRRERPRPWETTPVFSDVPALVVPFSDRPLFGPGRRAPVSRGGPSPVAILKLDLDYIVEELLPLLTERHFGDGAYQVDVTRPGSLSGPDNSSASRPVVYRSGGAEGPPGADASVPLFGLLPAREFPALLLEAGYSAREFSDAGRRGPATRGLRAPAAARGGERSWWVHARHRSGSLEAAIAAVRFRNLFISFGILLLMAGSVALILLSAKRAQDLARQKMEFVAGVSHELRTPLAVICSAGQNLADGVTGDPARVRDYGKLIHNEGRRLTEMVAQVLEHSAAGSGRKAYSKARLSVRDVVERALSDCKTLIDEGGFTVDESYAEDLPEVEGDAEALRRAVQNLIVNAIKYAGDRTWIGIRVASAPRAAGAELSITVEDRGRGIEESERERIFEPFFRGAAAVADQIHGNGLGLSLVRQIATAHGGRVEVATSTSGADRGSAFTLHLPAALPASKSASAESRGDVDDEIGQHARG